MPSFGPSSLSMTVPPTCYGEAEGTSGEVPPNPVPAEGLDAEENAVRAWNLPGENAEMAESAAEQADVLPLAPAATSAKAVEPADHLDMDFPPRIILEPNVYSSFILCVAKGEVYGILSTFTVVLVSAVIQMCFAFLLVPNIIPDDISDYTEIEDIGNFFKIWKNSTNGGESPYMAGASVADWSCTGGFTWMGQTVSSMAELYGSNVDKAGLVFCVLCMFIWSLMVLKEIRMSLNFLLLVMLPSTVIGQPDFRPSKGDEAGCLVSLSMVGKVAVVFCVLLRLVITLVLGYYGCRFVAMTSDLGDMVLNCAALTFIYDVSSLFSDVVLSYAKKMELDSLDTLYVPKGQIRRLCVLSRNFTEAINVTLPAIVTLLFLVFTANPFQLELLQNAYKIMCEDGKGEGPPPRPSSR
eukprot:TRINITY_DN18755_c0_g1_i1.p1 TRINITY_DN18755_c0_g1~~TRINITY_DN18755_c0_g1_i1.p1  ORF type:complete len:410 (-),score=53.55 TRINITY_DN18755_c0_g1_i1:81-1310(-)